MKAGGSGMSTRGAMATEIAGILDENGTFSVRVTPGASSDSIQIDDDRLTVRVTARADGGKANAAVTKLIARAMGRAKSDLELVRGATARDKVFRLRG